MRERPNEDTFGRSLSPSVVIVLVSSSKVYRPAITLNRELPKKVHRGRSWKLWVEERLSRTRTACPTKLLLDRLPLLFVSEVGTTRTITKSLRP